MKKLIKFLLSFGPGIFAIGYTIGTGSVTAMIVAGNDFGMDLLWVLFFSCLFSGVLIYVSGSYYLSTGETALYAVKKHIPLGKSIAIAISWYWSMEFAYWYIRHHLQCYLRSAIS